MSAYNTTHFGTGIFSNHQNSTSYSMNGVTANGTVHNLPATAYVRFSAYAQRALPLSRLQPQPDSPRILFIKHSDSTGMDDFLELKGTIIPKEELTEEQIPYYNYTCQPGDYIKTCLFFSLVQRKRFGKRKRCWKSEHCPQQSDFATWLHSLYLPLHQNKR